MSNCIMPDCHREPQNPESSEPLCFFHKIRTVGFDFSNMGQLRNRLYPGLTGKETTDRIQRLAEEQGDRAIPAGRAVLR